MIDEAGQSDLASILPLLFRAKRAVFVGDPKQLKHIPGITLKQEAYVSGQTDTSDLLVNFSPISRSAYDLAASAAVKRSEAETKFAGIMNELGLQFREEVPLYRDENRAPYRLDFVYVSPSGTRYNLEVDGGAHNENERFQHDLIRDKVSEAAGFTVVRLPAIDVLHNSAVVADRLKRLA